MDKKENQKIIFLAQRWVNLDKPNMNEFSEKTGMSVRELNRIRNLSFWQVAVMHAEHNKSLKEKKRKSLNNGENIPKHLLEQAVFLWLAGWSYKEIGDAVGRHFSTIKYWKSTQAWADSEEEVLMSKLKMHLLNKGITIQDMLNQIFKSDGGRDE